MEGERISCSHNEQLAPRELLPFLTARLLSRYRNQLWLAQMNRNVRSEASMPRKRRCDAAWNPTSVTKKFKDAKDDELSEFMIIGIDFGTTYSGVGWATSGDISNDHINVIMTWGGRTEEVKVPTKLYYENGELHSWGSLVPDDVEPLCWFKLLLLRDEDVPADVWSSGPFTAARRKLEQLGKTPVEVIADYLTQLWSHTLEVITKARTAVIVEAYRFHVVLSIPASWKDYARSAMQDAADQAGITAERSAGPTELSFVIEPEAAAFATIWEKKRELKKDDVYMICDAGGGTVEIISYRIGSVDPIELHEVVGGEAGICGGAFIDEKFMRICQTRLGRLWHRLSPHGINEIMQKEWEYACKTTFSGKKKDQEYIMSIPFEAFETISDSNDTSREPHIKNGRIHFSWYQQPQPISDIQKAFDQSFSNIGDLIDTQISRSTEFPMTAIILVGGLGASPYLYEHLSNKYLDKVDILQAGGTKPRSAICRGAVYRGFMDRLNAGADGSGTVPIFVASTIARLSLGVEMRVPFVPGVHLRDDKVWESREAKWKANNQMKWYLKKGDVVDTSRAIRHPFYKVLTTKEIKNGIRTAILQCELDNPPTRRDSTVTKLGTMFCETKSLDSNDMENFHSPKGRRYKKITYEIEMIPSGASTAVAGYCGEKKLGSQDCKLELM